MELVAPALGIVLTILLIFEAVRRIRRKARSASPTPPGQMTITLDATLTSVVIHVSPSPSPGQTSTAGESTPRVGLATHATHQPDATHPDRLRLEQALRSYPLVDSRAESITVFELLTKRFEEALGVEDPETVASRNALAIAYQDAGRADDALPLHEANLPVMVVMLGAEHPEAVACRNNLLSAYHQTGRTEEEK